MGATISVKGQEDDNDLEKLEFELTGLMRKFRGLKPRADNNFALNRPEALSKAIGATFDIVGFAGTVIGAFSILIGVIGIANIMFVSVRERTNIIGIQKSLGAKNYFILYQFLFESIFLSCLGGSVGILMVYLLSFASLGTLEIELTIKNVAIGTSISIVTGIAAGIIPAYMASRLDPVEAIRAK